MGLRVGRRSGWWPRWRAARRRRGQRFAVRIARIAGFTGDGVGKIQFRLATLAGTGVRHRQRRRAWLADRRIGTIGRQKLGGAEPGEEKRRAKKGLKERPGKKMGKKNLKNRSQGPQ